MDSLLLNIKTHGNSDIGYLSFFEGDKDIPFEIKRVYYIYNVPTGVKRGMHAHKELQQILWCTYGKVEVLVDDGEEKKSYLLDSPLKALLIPKGYWHYMIWSQEGSVLCAAASDYYDEKDYIRAYDEFLQYVRKGYWNEK